MTTPDYPRTHADTMAEWTPPAPVQIPPVRYAPAGQSPICLEGTGVVVLPESVFWRLLDGYMGNRMPYDQVAETPARTRRTQEDPNIWITEDMEDEEDDDPDPFQMSSVLDPVTMRQVRRTNLTPTRISAIWTGLPVVEAQVPQTPEAE